jgi:hypothetical protein
VKIYLFSQKTRKIDTHIDDFTFNARSTFLCLMNSVFNMYLDKFVLVLVDDIFVYSKTIKEHKENIKMVL